MVFKEASGRFRCGQGKGSHRMRPADPNKARRYLAAGQSRLMCGDSTSGADRQAHGRDHARWRLLLRPTPWQGVRESGQRAVVRNHAPGIQNICGRGLSSAGTAATSRHRFAVLEPDADVLGADVRGQRLSAYLDPHMEKAGHEFAGPYHLVTNKPVQQYESLRRWRQRKPRSTTTGISVLSAFAGHSTGS
jgi:hypothetical protein